ncbi:hypothetical protein ACFQBY_01990 [Promicromonospora citrea]|uniref:ABC-2 type transport system permease protein n=1 Tax=Promicromonospora citrea TaxID=43677 RepID=A0A8H9L2Q2_9MICO|nr:ABC transporter permease [Promicromonospora citrea]NNH52582.1 ABC transporter permease [Promicromonospora citrea]GGM21242.1 hypothetical protein GCM10010102_16200 [Promicromonospora citrea]
MRPGQVTAVHLARTTAAELSKLRTLPAVGLTAAATVVAGGTVAALAASSAVAGGASPTAAGVVTEVVRFVQAGMVLVGVLPVAHESAGTQLRTTFAAVPRRAVLVAAKTLAALVALVFTAAGTVCAMVGGAVVGSAMAATAPAWGVPGETEPRWAGPGAVVVSGEDLGRLAGAAVFLVLVGVLAHAVALLLRELVPALVTTLGLVLIVSPLLGSLTEHARWLPDRAAALLWAPADPVLGPADGALVATAWVLVVGASGGIRLLSSDAAG